jgi:hypothetical protein
MSASGQAVVKPGLSRGQGGLKRWSSGGQAELKPRSYSRSYIPLSLVNIGPATPLKIEIDSVFGGEL